MSTTKIAYDPALDDEEWREVNFSESQIAAAAHTSGKQPTAEELIKYAEKYGPEGVLDSAIMLTQFQYRKVAEALAKMRRR